MDCEQILPSVSSLNKNYWCDWAKLSTSGFLMANKSYITLLVSYLSELSVIKSTRNKQREMFTPACS